MFRYRFKRVEAKPVATADQVEVRDKRFSLDIDTIPILNRLRLTNTLQPVLSIGVVYDPATGKLKMSEAVSEVVARLHGSYYGESLPREVVPGYYPAALDQNHRLLVRADTIEPYLEKLTYDGEGRLRVTDERVLEILQNLQFTREGELYVSDPRLGTLLQALAYPSISGLLTTTPLAANGTYYSFAIDFWLSSLGALGCVGFADQPSATDGVYVQLSNDAVNWDYRGATVTAPANAGVSLCQVVTAQYARVVWRNGPTAQTVFRLGARTFIAGSENPPVGPSPPSPETAVCADCGKDMTETGDFFLEPDGKVYCPKCYANKRYKEMKRKKEDLNPWLKSWRAFLKDDEARAKLHAPDRFLEGG